MRPCLKEHWKVVIWKKINWRLKKKKVKVWFCAMWLFESNTFDFHEDYNEQIQKLSTADKCMSFGEEKQGCAREQRIRWWVKLPGRWLNLDKLPKHFNSSHHCSRHFSMLLFFFFHAFNLSADHNTLSKRCCQQLLPTEGCINDRKRAGVWAGKARGWPSDDGEATRNKVKGVAAWIWVSQENMRFAVWSS